VTEDEADEKDDATIAEDVAAEAEATAVAASTSFSFSDRGGRKKQPRTSNVL